MKSAVFVATAAVAAGLLLTVGSAVAAPKAVTKKVVSTTVSLRATKAPDGTVTGTVELMSPDRRCLNSGRAAKGSIVGAIARLGFGPLTGRERKGDVYPPPYPGVPAEGAGYSLPLVAEGTPGRTQRTFQATFPGTEEMRVHSYSTGFPEELPGRTVGEAEDLGFGMELYARHVPYNRHGKKFELVCPGKRVNKWLTIFPQ